MLINKTPRGKKFIIGPNHSCEYWEYSVLNPPLLPTEAAFLRRRRRAAFLMRRRSIIILVGIIIILVGIIIILV
jgi:hypothetical protein